jgi:PelA/Pel-15E family pectate lyase
MKRSGALPNRITTLIGILSIGGSTLFAEPSVQEVEQALERAVTYFSESVAVEGGYVYFYSPDLSRRLGEGAARETEIWVQPPGTPTVGEALLEAWLATGDPGFREAALAAGKALVYGQLESGGWRNSIEFDPAGPRVDQYRNGKGRGKNYSTLDDEISQAALKFLVRLDHALESQVPEIKDAVAYGLDRFLQAQFANGAFPQVWLGPVPAVTPAKANYPEYDWRTEGRIKEYWDQYTLNDGVAGSVTDLLRTAHQLAGDDRCLEALRKLGGFLIDAQMPDPQPAWAQQYNQQMQPIWARAFEPPAISGRESEDAMIALLKIAEHTGDKKYLEPIVPAVKYLESSLLPDGRLARYYELQSNRPLYMERSGKVYSLTHDDSNLPSHYGWKNETQLETIKNGYRAVVAGQPLAGVLESASPPGEIEEIADSLDDQGRWISRYEGELLIGQAKFPVGDLYLSSEVFADNVVALSRWLVAKKR